MRILAVLLIASLSVSGCIPLAIGYAAYEWGKSSDRESRADLLKECIKADAQNTPICQKFLNQERQASE